MKQHHLHTVSTVAGFITALVGLLVLVGWQFDIAILKATMPNGLVMKANTGAAFLLAGIALLLLQHNGPVRTWLVRCCGILITLVGFLTVCEYAFGWDLGIDEMLFREPGELIATSHRGRMAPNTALNFTLIGFAILALTVKNLRSRFFVEFPLVFSLVIGLLGVIGYASGLVELTGPAVYTQIAANSAATFIILSLGLLIAEYARQGVPLSIEQKLFAALTSVGAILLFISLLAVSGLQSLQHTRESEEGTQRLKTLLADVFAQLVVIQESAEGYVLSGQDRFKTSFAEAAAKLPRLLDDLRSQTEGRLYAHDELSILEQLAGRRIQFSQELMRLRNTQGFESANAYFGTAKEELLTDSIHALITSMIAEEDALLRARDAEEEHQANRTKIIISAGIAVQAFLLAFIFFVVNRDVTGRRKAEADLLAAKHQLEERVRQRTAELAEAYEAAKASEARMGGIVNSAMDAIISIDEEQRIVLFNAAAEKTFGVRADVVVGQPVDILIPHRFREQHRRDVAAFAKTGVTSRSMGHLGALSGLHADGHEFPMEASISQLEIAGQKIFTVILRDITERKRAEEELRNSEHRYRSTLDHMMEGCQIVGFDWRYLYVNEAAATHGRTTRERLLGHTMMEMYPGIETTSFFQQLRRCMTERTPLHLENEFRFPDGMKGWFNLSLEPVPEGVFILSEDITNEKLMNAELENHRQHLEELVTERTAALRAANDELEAFSYSVSHDLRAPLRHIDGFADLLHKHASSQLDETGRRYLDTISGAARKMGLLIDELLVFSRMGRTEMQRSVVDLYQLSLDVKDELTPETAGRVIEWRVDRLPRVTGDPSMLRLVLVNLFSNAIKYTRERPRACIEVGFHTNDRETIFHVRDNGAGFDMTYAGKLFGVFQRLHRDSEFEGIGIGLANVRRIIHRHGGRTWAEGKVGSGATFYFTLPTLTLTGTDEDLANDHHG